MKYTYAVKHNGVFYPAGADVPVGDEPKVETPKVEVKAEPKVEAEPKVVPTKATPKKRSKK